MQTFTFVCAEHQEFGTLGWRLQSQPDFDPLGGMGVAHDCLEHFTDSAQPSDEFLALGASMYIRDESYHYRKGHYETNPGVHIASDLPEIMRHITNEGYGLATAPRTRATDEYVEGYIDRMFSEYQKNIRDEYDAKELRLSSETIRSIRSWIRIGYRKAQLRYPVPHKAQDMFCHIEDKADQALKHAEEGMLLHVRVDFKNTAVKVLGPEYED